MLQDDLTSQPHEPLSPTSKKKTCSEVSPSSTLTPIPMRLPVFLRLISAVHSKSTERCTQTVRVYYQYSSLCWLKCPWILCQNENVLTLNYYLPVTIQTNVEYVRLHCVLFKTHLVLRNFGCFCTLLFSQRMQRQKQLLFWWAAVFNILSSSPPVITYWGSYACKYIWVCPWCFKNINPFIHSISKHLLST